MHHPKGILPARTPLSVFCGWKYAFVVWMTLAGGCAGVDPVPEVPSQSTYPVRYLLDLMGEGHGLQEPFSMMTITHPRLPGDRLGAAGLLVVHTHPVVAGDESESYAAFDLACPYEWPSVVAIEISPGGIMEAVCPACGTVYDFSLGAGIPKAGKSPYSLWQYPVTLRESVLEISNGIIGF